MSILRVLILLVLLSGLSHQLPTVKYYEQIAMSLTAIATIVQTTWNTTDPRPATSVLVIGNSGTFVNHLPGMVGKIASSTRGNHKYRIYMYAEGGLGLKDQRNDPRVHELLKQKWDFVIL